MCGSMAFMSKLWKLVIACFLMIEKNIMHPQRQSETIFRWRISLVKDSFHNFLHKEVCHNRANGTAHQP